MKHYHVVAAIIQHQDRILCTQRGAGKFDYISFKYEFPGGKVEPGEHPKDALKREIREELELDIDVERSFLTVEHTYPDFKLTMESFLCSATDPTLTLTEHVDFKWLPKGQLNTLQWAGADIPIVEKLQK